jgi:hypothetical protein
MEDDMRRLAAVLPNMIRSPDTTKTTAGAA